jgi:hypothetical protein
LAGVEIRAACDSDPARQTTYATAALMLNHEFSDFVNIATRPDTHLDLLALALPRGISAVVQNSLPPILALPASCFALPEPCPPCCMKIGAGNPGRQDPASPSLTTSRQ